MLSKILHIGLAMILCQIPVLMQSFPPSFELADREGLKHHTVYSCQVIHNKSDTKQYTLKPKTSTLKRGHIIYYASTGIYLEDKETWFLFSVFRRLYPHICVLFGDPVILTAFLKALASWDLI